MSLYSNDYETDNLMQQIYQLIDSDHEQEKQKVLLTNYQLVNSILSNQLIINKINNHLTNNHYSSILKFSLTPKIQLDLVDISNIFAHFGLVQHIELQGNIAFVIFDNAINAFICQQFLNNLFISQLNTTISLEFHTTKEEAIQQPKFTCKYPIQIENEKSFQVARKIIGSKGCHMKKIIQICLADLKIDLNKQEIVKLRLRGRGSGYKEGPDQQESNESLHLCVSSKYQHTYIKACNLVEEHLQKIYQEFNRQFRQDICIKKQEQKDLHKMEVNQCRQVLPLVKQISC